MKKILAWYRSRGVPQSLATLAKKQRSTSRLYVVQMETQPSPQHAEQMSAALQPYRDKFGLDFIVLGPGITFKKFDDF